MGGSWCRNLGVRSQIAHQIIEDYKKSGNKYKKKQKNIKKGPNRGGRGSEKSAGSEKGERAHQLNFKYSGILTAVHI